MFTFQPIDEKTLKDERSKALLLPKGDYDFEVVKAISKISKSGNPMIEVILKVFHEESSRTVKDFLMTQNANVMYKFLHFCDTVGIRAQYDEGKIDVDTLAGRCGRVRLGIRKAEGDYPEQNTVVDYNPAAKAPVAIEDTIQF